jgi:hypothetical protein
LLIQNPESRIQNPDFQTRIQFSKETRMAQPDLPDIQLDANNLYREDVITDRRVGTLRKMTPITVDGAVDASRPTLFAGQTQLLTPGGVLPLGFDIEAATLAEALQKFPAAVQQALNDAIEEAREMRREAASRIVVPDAGAMAGSKIKMP